MALEIMRPQTPYVYRQSEEDPRIIERRLNRHNARWQWYRLLKTEDEARQTLLKLNTKETKNGKTSENSSRIGALQL